jgi:hypothetical protein
MKRRIAILIEIPCDDDQGIGRLRAFLKVALRAFGIRCIGLRPPEETRTFGQKEEDR